MSDEIKNGLAIISITILLFGYYPYFRDIYLGKTKPHAFSRLIRGILAGIGFAIQLHENGGLGSRMLGTTSIICFAIAIIGLYEKQTMYYVSDWVALGLAGTSILLWMLTNNPVYSVLLISFADFIGFIPTYRKIYHHPNSETLSTRYMMDFRTIIGIISLTTYSFNTIFYPGFVFLLNATAILMIHHRRRVYIRK